MRAAYDTHIFPGFRPVDGDGDILMADAHPVEHPRSDQMLIETPSGPRRQRGGGQRRFPNSPGTSQYRGQPTALRRPSAASSTTFEQRNPASSSFGNQLRHLPPPLPSSPTRLSSHAYLSAAMLPAPTSPEWRTLPPISAPFARPHGREGYEHPSRQTLLFAKTPTRQEVIDLTRDSSSPVTPHNRGVLPRPRNLGYEIDRLNQSERHEGPDQMTPNGLRVIGRPPIFPPAEVRFAHLPHWGEDDIRSQVPDHLHPPHLPRHDTQKVSCTACLEEFRRDDLNQVACNCRYCTPCLNLAFAAGCANIASFPPKCCGRPIRISIWGPLLEPGVLERYKKVENEFSAKRPFYCAAPKCSVFISEEDILPQQEVGVCPKCTSSTCVKCRRLMDDHPMWESERVCPKREENLVKLYELGSAKKWKQCPTCQVMVEKTDGCNHMDCVCGVEFCYRCGHLFDEDDSCECEPQWDEELEDEEDEDEDEDDSEEDEDDDSDEWPDYRVAVDPAGRIKCLHLHAAPLGTARVHCHGCLQRTLVLTCDECALELCQACVDHVRKSVASESDSSGDESMRIDVPRETRVGGLSRTQNLL